jgi:ribonuclease VapC
MIVETSALVAIVRGEADGEALFDKICDCKEARLLSAAGYLEAGIVVDGQKDPTKSASLDAFIAELRIDIAPVTEAQARIARQAYRDFGRGSGHPAKLNFGDCFAYALATDTNHPLLFKGEDFSHTGVRRA